MKYNLRCEEFALLFMHIVLEKGAVTFIFMKAQDSKQNPTQKIKTMLPFLRGDRVRILSDSSFSAHFSCRLRLNMRTLNMMSNSFA